MRPTKWKDRYLANQFAVPTLSAVGAFKSVEEEGFLIALLATRTFCYECYKPSSQLIV